MAHRFENLVETIPAGGQERTVIVNCEDWEGSRFVELRQQSWGGERVGWFTQSSVRMAPENVALVRRALGVAEALPEMVAAKQDKRVLVTSSATRENASLEAPSLRVWHAESA
ncbi:MAG: hypothetical protein WD045_06675 [Pirellulaceae bacterium]